VPYGAPQYPGTFGPVLPDHPQATTVLILGIVGAVACTPLAPFAWVMGNRVVKEIDASGGTLGGRSTANVGRILGIVWSLLMLLGLVVGVLAVIVLLLTAPT
jgi:phosphotransferase system  glucose/maltose/N-acetylglucosamine-specific IIC component